MKKKISQIYKIKKKYINKSQKYLNKKNKTINISGRAISKRTMKKNTFINVQDIKGNIQILINYNIFKDQYKKIIKNIKLGDIILIKGKICKTNIGELTIKCKKIKNLVKIKIPYPDKFNKIKNKETKYRKRYLDLIINEKTRKTFLKRIKLIKLIRKYLHKKKYSEVETPMLHNIPGGANAKPFKTFHNSLNTKMYLRIAPELYLKQLIIGGFTKIFELNRNFRNEGISTLHNPEFSMIEIYQTNVDYKNMMYLLENMITYLIKNINLNIKKIIYKKKTINFNRPYKKITLKKIIYKHHRKYCKNINKINNIHFLIKLCRKLNLNTQNIKNKDEIIIKIFEETIQKKIIQPTFITQYPKSISPLAKENKKNNKITDRFELFINGYEIANGFTELNNYKEQRIRFKKQILKNKKYNKNEEFYYDKEYIEALKYGLPPTSGVGMGIDRLIMLLTNNNNIKDVIFFPTLKKI